ncbi:hypothetical protein ACE1B6_02800 [Aerosakkonemataceae cyanobacterium BLCC-F154]|uniref:Uncharacterized protein n=1 Tax=Floridaenema fluviatile BLCC-F154 TaxID=3153640 RepID=A0ABV4Y600_9CYAN
MKRKHTDFILDALANAAVLVSLYTCNVFVGIAVTPLAIVCLINKYRDEDKDNDRNETNAK